MKNLLLLCLLISCGQYEEKYLYDEHDEEYDTVLQLSLQECIEKNPIFKSLDRTSDFVGFGYEVGTIYQLTEEVKDRDKILRFAKILSIDSGVMRIALRSPDSTEDKVITYTQEQNKKILETMAIGVCSLEKFYGHSSLNSLQTLSYSYKRKDIYSGTEQNPVNYLERKETYNLNTNFPLVLHLFNGVREDEKKIDDTTYKTTTNFSIKSITSNDCREQAICDFVVTPSLECNAVVDIKHYLKETTSDLLIDFESDCI